jgi:hypothetical protein
MKVFQGLRKQLIEKNRSKVEAGEIKKHYLSLLIQPGKIYGKVFRIYRLIEIASSAKRFVN